MFRVQAAAKGIDFIFKRPSVLPLVVYADEKRLRQVLINLLSNALKFTQTGSVRFVVHYRSPVAEFEVVDTGPGIQASDLERIFAPFERGALGVSQPHTGTGLGLTISRLLAGVMGGDIKVSSTVGSGSNFRMKILLSEVTNPRRIAPVGAPIYGYHGPRKTILITDDDPTHRDLLREVLTPLGFILLSAPDGPACLTLAQHCRPDLFLLDISMAGMDGWTVAETLRATGHHQARILMVSASALEAHGTPLAQPFHDGYLMKPIDIPKLVETIRQLLKIEWQYEAEQIPEPRWKPETGSRPPVKYVEELIGLGQLGYIRAIQIKLDEIGHDHVPIIFMTGLAETEHIVRGLEAGGVDYVTKPIAVEEMLARIRVHLANARLTQSARAALDVSGRYLLAVNGVGKIIWATPQAQKLLSDALSPDSDDDVVLPDPIPQWLDQARKGKV